MCHAKRDGVVGNVTRVRTSYTHKIDSGTPVGASADTASLLGCHSASAELPGDPFLVEARPPPPRCRWPSRTGGHRSPGGCRRLRSKASARGSLALPGTVAPDGPSRGRPSSAQQSSPSSPSRAGGLSPAPRPGYARQRGVARARGREARQRGAQAARGKDHLNFLYSGLTPRHRTHAHDQEKTAGR